jgi:excinuclease ABC subunit C
MEQSIVETARSLPQKPGVYLYYNDADVVIYVGKAKNLRARVSSYFRASAHLTPAKKIMVSEIARIETILVRTETEALLLESMQIKKYRPKYNIILKDDKDFQYIRIALQEEFPSVTTVRTLVLDGSRYFGPYTSGLAVRQTMRLLKRLFPYKSCSNPVDRPCFDYQLGRCLGHTTAPDSKERYQQIIEQLIQFLSGNTGDVIKKLRAAMANASAAHEYEEAARYRDRLQALEHVLEQQTVITAGGGSFDVLGLAREGNLASVNLFQIRRGKLVQRDSFLLQHVEDQTDVDILSAFISQYYGQSTNHPSDVYLPALPSTDLANALQLHFHLPQRGLKKKLATMVTENAIEHVRRSRQQWLSEEAKAKLALEELAHALHLDGQPKRIEMYDISHNQSTNVVGSMVVFEDGRPKKSEYRKFLIKNTAIPDDQHRLAEVLQRRFARHEGSEWPLPDLLLLDGGKGQLSVVLNSVPGLTEHVPVAALAKEHEELFVPGEKKSIRLPDGSQELFLIQRIRDEAHRFAISFYRKKHRAATTRSLLDEIPGLGIHGKRLLRERFGTMSEIRKADHEELIRLLGKKVAAALIRQLG